MTISCVKGIIEFHVLLSRQYYINLEKKIWVNARIEFNHVMSKFSGEIMKTYTVWAFKTYL